MKRALLWGIQFYRSAISPYKGGPRCRYTPTWQPVRANRH